MKCKGLILILYNHQAIVSRIHFQGNLTMENNIPYTALTKLDTDQIT